MSLHRPIPVRPAHVILAEWRSIEHRTRTTSANGPERLRLALRIEELRAEYQATVAAVARRLRDEEVDARRPEERVAAG